MKEFNSWFQIAFSFRGKDFEKTISLNQLIIEDDTWYYYFDINVRGDVYTIEVFGTYDDYGNVRTSGDCIVNDCNTSAAFGINVSDDDGDIVEYIDDIDIIDCD